MPRTKPLPEREIQIAHRLRKARDFRKYSREFLQHMTGIDPQAIARVEWGRVALGYRLAWHVLGELDVSATWLATGEGDMIPGFRIPQLYDLGITEDRLFSEVFDNILKPVIVEKQGQKGLVKGFEEFSEDDARKVLLLTLVRWLEDTIIATPIERLGELQKHTLSSFQEFLSKGKTTDERILLKARAALSQERYDFLLNWYWQTRHLMPGQEKKDLPDKATPLRVSGNVKARKSELELPGLLHRLKQATLASGKKSELAEYLRRVTGDKVPLASVSRWLSGEREPGGEVALQLDAWATAQGFPRAS